MELTTLRDATARQHRQLEKDLDLLRPSLSRGEYVALLERFYGFYARWEERVAELLETHLPDCFANQAQEMHGVERPPEEARSISAHPVAHPLPLRFGSRQKLWRLEQDLRFFGWATEDLARIRRCEKLPALNSIGAVLGSLYVIEGSSLGGQILARHFQGQLGIRPEAGCRYFSGYGDQTGRMWTEFKELMRLRPATEDEAMLAGACTTFEVLGEWLGDKRNG